MYACLCNRHQYCRLYIHKFYVAEALFLLCCIALDKALSDAPRAAVMASKTTTRISWEFLRIR